MEERPLLESQRMTDFEALMWNLDKDPRLSNVIANVSMLDRAPDRERLRRRLDRAARVIPRLHQRVVPALGRLAPPSWQPDPYFDLDHHLRWVAAPLGASRRASLDLLMQMFLDPLDRTRPLWEFVVIEGLRGGKAMMLQRIHHTVTDGKGGLRISEQFVDLERDAPDPPDMPPFATSPLDATLWSTATDTFSHVARRQIGVVSRSAQAITDPAQLIRSGRRAVEIVESTLRQAQVVDQARSPLWTDRSLSRRFDTIDVPFDDARAAARMLGGSLNDFFVTGAADAAGDYHRRLGEPVDSLRMAMPVSTRTDRSAGGNFFTPTQSVVPTGSMSPAERFALIHELLQRTRSEPALGAIEGLAGAINLLPTSVLVRTGLRMAGSVDFVTSNLRAAPFDVYLAGALMEGNYPIGPLAGTAFNLTMMSYRGTMCMGLVSDPAATTDGDLLVSCLRRSYRALLRAGESARPPRARTD